jgi:sialic acid synthase SpsE
MEKINVNGFEIGGDKTFIIADIGSNHKQDLALAKESIDAASKAGADAIKFQSIQLQELYLDPDLKTTKFIRQLELPEDWHKTLKAYCDERNILFFSSPTYLKAVDLLESVNVPLYKLASAQIGTFPQIVEKVALLQKPTIFSTGIAAYNEVIDAVNIFKRNGNQQFIILHCNSIYPTPPEKVNLQMIKTYKYMFGNPVGFSDHTIGTHICCAAVSMGASVIEKHFTLDRKIKTPDSNLFACDPKELRSLVNQIRDIESASFKFEDRLDIQNEEKSFKDSITYRIIAKNLIQAYTVITENDVKYLRSSKGINCKDFASIIGRTTTRTIKAGEPLLYECIR